MLTFDPGVDDIDIDEFFFCDIETNGLDFREHGILELSYAVGIGPVKTIHRTHAQYEHLFRTASPESLVVNGYTQDKVTNENLAMDWADYYNAVTEFHTAIKGKTFLNANPAFDARFISNNLFGNFSQGEPWFYRLHDIQAWYAGIMRRKKLTGFHPMCAEMRELGYDIHEPDHTSQADVIAVRDLFLAINREYL